MQIISNCRTFDGSALSKFVTQLDYRVAGVTVEGAKGQVELEVLYQGTPVTISRDSEPEYWIYENDQWWLESSGYWMDGMERSGDGCFYGKVPPIPIFP